MGFRRNSFRYSTDKGDPINYRPVVEALASKHLIDADGFAPADAWMAETLTHRYPLTLERIARGHTRAALNPATILISLDNAYVHASWFIKLGSDVVRFGGTHGALDDLNSDGIVTEQLRSHPRHFRQPHRRSVWWVQRVARLSGGRTGRRMGLRQRPTPGSHSPHAA